MTAPAQMTHRVELAMPRLRRPRALTSLPTRVHSATLALIAAGLGLLVATTGRAADNRTTLFHAAAFVAADLGVWDLAGRGWALLAACPFLILLDLVASDPELE